MRVKVSRIHKGEGGRHYEARRGTVVVATIRYVDRSEARSAGGSVQEAHWKLTQKSGRIDRFDSFSAARDEARKL